MLDVLRYAVIAGAFVALGFNVALFTHAEDILKAWKIKPWRWYLVGDSGFIIYIIITMKEAIDSGDPFGYRAPLALGAMMLTLVSMVVLFLSGRDKDK